MEKRLAIIGIIINNREQSAQTVNNILASYGEMIVGRLGIPYKEKNVSVITVIADATNDELDALSGKLENIPGVKAKVMITS